VTDKRPVFLNLLKIKLPLPGLVSFLHRVSGVLLFLAIPICLFILEQSLASPSGFAAINEFLSNPLIVSMVFVLLLALSHHLLAGLRFLLMDLEIGLSKSISMQSSRAVFIGAVVLALLLTLGIYQ
jgi:succinate dehydrogenase / fumarate reductase cytochrome b subunit